MLGFISAREQLVKERQKNAAMQAQIAKANSDIEYLAMMTDIEMEQEEDEQEVQDHGEEE